jgi:hypothetical protein
MYPGIRGKTHGDKKLINPAPAAINNSIILLLIYIDFKQKNNQNCIY